jgi:Tol biopolymer transport system component
MIVSKGPNSHNTDGATFVVVSPANGAWKPFTTLDSSRGDLAHGLPEFLPDGRRVAFTVVSSNPQKSGVYVASLDSRSAVRASGRGCPTTAAASRSGEPTAGSSSMSRRTGA